MLQLINDDSKTVSATYIRTVHERVTAVTHRILNLIYSKAKEEDEKEKREKDLKRPYPYSFQLLSDLTDSTYVSKKTKD